jgi:hypothetical protein
VAQKTIQTLSYIFCYLIGACNIPYIKSMKNINKMLEIADKQQYNQNNTTITHK